MPLPDLIEIREKTTASAESATAMDELKFPKVPHCAPTSTTMAAERIAPTAYAIRNPTKQITESTTNIAATERRTVGRYVKRLVGHPLEGQLVGELIVRNEM